MGILQESDIAMENGPFEDVFPIENGDNPVSYVSLPDGYIVFYQSPIPHRIHVWYIYLHLP